MQPLVQSASGGWTQCDEPVFPEFPSMNEQGVALQIDIAEIKSGGFGDPQPCCVEQADEDADARGANAAFRGERR